MTMECETHKVIPPYKQEFLNWLARYRGTDLIANLVRHCEYSPDDTAQMKENLRKWLVLKSKNQKEENHARALG